MVPSVFAKYENIEFSFGVSIFYHTNVWKEDWRWDYTSDINEIISTLKVTYKDSLWKIVSGKPEIIILELCNH